METLWVRKPWPSPPPSPARQGSSRRYVAIILMLCTACFAAGVVTPDWEGSESSRSLTMREALRVMRDRTKPKETRHAAAVAAFKLCEDAGKTVREVAPDVESYEGEVAEWRRRVSKAWEKE